MSFIRHFSGERRGKLSAATELEGSLLMSFNPFSYYMLVAFEAGSPLRAMTLLLAYPIILSLNLTGYEEAAISVMTFLSTAGIRVAEVKAVAKATLCRFYLADLRESAYKVFSSCRGENYVITSFPRIMVEPFLREYLDVDRVIATELMMVGSYCSGIRATPGVMAGGWRLLALRAVMVDGKEMVDVVIGSGLKDHPFMLLCGESKKKNYLGDAEREATGERRRRRRSRGGDAEGGSPPDNRRATEPTTAARLRRKESRKARRKQILLKANKHSICSSSFKTRRSVQGKQI